VGRAATGAVGHTGSEIEDESRGSAGEWKRQKEKKRKKNKGTMTILSFWTKNCFSSPSESTPHMKPQLKLLTGPLFNRNVFSGG
jgi:hypothetical protein